MDNNRFLFLLAKKLSGDLTPEEETSFKQAIESNETYRQKFHYFREFWNDEKVHPSQVQDKLDSVWEKIEKEGDEAVNLFEDPVPERKKAFVGLAKIAKIAALFILFLGSYFLYEKVTSPEKEPAIAKPLAYLTKSTSDTGKTYFKLPDGTSIWLNRNSRIEYNADFGVSKREITLLGEAFFDVAENKKVPLVIHAQHIDIEVKGTAFNVCAYSSGHFIETALVRGLVSIRDNRNNGKEILLQPNQKFIAPIQGKEEEGSAVMNPDLIPGKEYVITPLAVDPSSQLLPETAWMNNKLVFNRSTFQEVAAMMERWYGVEIEIDGESIKHQKLSGAFDTETLEQALMALQLTCDFHFHIDNNKVTITP